MQLDAMGMAVAFAAVLPALLVAHNVADHWVQTESQSVHKGWRSHAGRLACLRHVASYTMVTAGTVALLWWLLGLPITPAGFVAGQLVSAVTHYWADRRHTLARLAALVGKGGFVTFGAPRPGRDDNPTLGTGAYALDQSWHWLWLGVAALLTAVA
ncbi:hypothetical protein JOF41_006451 [Saccharothrix coeruleofusca]|uniref:DUF3307 domain-containing protein n=1 Tax=Saccharothrix coeruleofusca TaxID=33919 RepID=UPI001AE8C1BB|nr:DUF3307 domain-containing protein [Saccharothrix coeruleofusca]MBP2340273.1 hypothetical protein [Saccharothrix coeruleofusca]